MERDQPDGATSDDDQVVMKIGGCGSGREGSRAARMNIEQILRMVVEHFVLNKIKNGL
jgi:hypothetical protein